MTNETTEPDPLQEVRDRASAYQARLDSPTDNPKADTFALAAVRAAARYAVIEHDVPKADVAAAARVEVGELEAWL